MRDVLGDLVAWWRSGATVGMGTVVGSLKATNTRRARSAFAWASSAKASWNARRRKSAAP